MGGSASSLKYSPVNENIPLATIEKPRKIAASIDLRSDEISMIERRRGVCSSTNAVLTTLLLECERNDTSIVLPSLVALSEAASMTDGVSNPYRVVAALNDGIPPDGGNTLFTSEERCELPLLSLNRVECDVDTFTAWLSAGRSLICITKVKEDTLEDGEWKSSGDFAGVMCSCVVGYNKFSKTFILSQVNFSKHGVLYMPFTDLSSFVLEAFILEMTYNYIHHPLFIQ